MENTNEFVETTTPVEEETMEETENQEEEEQQQEEETTPSSPQAMTQQTNDANADLTAIARHRIEKQKYIDEKDAKAKEERQKAIDEANKYKESLIEERNHKLSINKKKNREEEEKLYAATEDKSENPWEDVNKYVDFKFAEKMRMKDTTRYKKILIRLKNQRIAKE